MLMRNRFKMRKQIFEIVESALLDAITPQVWAISVIIEPARKVIISMFVQGHLPETERSYLNSISEELLYALPQVPNVKIVLFNDAMQPLKPIGVWLFIRQGVEVERNISAELFT